MFNLTRHLGPLLGPLRVISRHLSDASRTFALPLTSDVMRDAANRRNVPTRRRQRLSGSILLPQAHTRSDEAANPGGLDTSAGLDHSAVYFACTFFHTFTGEIGPSGVSTLLPVSVIVSP